jgi:ketosteroid isomerase-like protein
MKFAGTPIRWENISMNSIMKKLIAMKSMPVLALVLLVVLGSVLAGDGATEPLPALGCTITCDFAGHLETFDDAGRLLAWDGKIHGDIEGRILWWFDLANLRTIGQVSHYVARWEIYDLADNLLLAGDSAGTTATPPGEDGIWRGKGIVTEASTGFENWIGRQIYEAGNVTYDEAGAPKGGGGTFRIVPVVDFNGDGKVDSADICIMAGHWNTGEPVCDIGPTSLGDGIVDGQDLLVLAEYLVAGQVDVEADAIYADMCDLYTLAVETGDVDLYVANYTNDAVQIPPDAPSRIGSGQIRAAIEPALTQFNVVCPIYPQEAKVIGNWAFGWCDWSLSLTPKEGGETTTFDGKGLDVLKRQPDGSWKYYISCWNYNGPPTVE